MRMRIIAVIYTVLMVLILKFVLDSFGQNDFNRRDIIYYNDIIKQVYEEYNKGEDISTLEKKWGCDIVLYGDDDYTATIYKYYGGYGLVADFAPAESDSGEEWNRMDESGSGEEWNRIDESVTMNDSVSSGDERSETNHAYSDNISQVTSGVDSNNRVIGKICFAAEENAFTDAENNVRRSSIIIWCVILASGYILMLILYINYIRPFRELQHFTTEIAKGNLDVTLPIHKENMFGAFTESFDVMREELAASRQREAEAEKSKKELVAQLSHDIKTPVATIKATCEVLELKERMKLDKSENDSTLEKIGYISSKADTIDQLISNMFHATLEELEVLEVKPVETDSRVLNEIFSGMSQAGNIIMNNPVPECLVYMDKLRMEQVIGNVVGNSFKYAGTDIEVSFDMIDSDIDSDILINNTNMAKDMNIYKNIRGNKFLRITISDHGSGIPDEELYRVTEKFYRGSNSTGKQGSGLGLYLASFFMEKQMGGFECHNLKTTPEAADNEGLVVELFLRKV